MERSQVVIARGLQHRRQPPAFVPGGCEIASDGTISLRQRGKRWLLHAAIHEACGEPHLGGRGLHGEQAMGFATTIRPLDELQLCAPVLDKRKNLSLPSLDE